MPHSPIAETEFGRSIHIFRTNLPLSTETGKPKAAREWVVADAVIIEPISTLKFAANRKNREFCDFEAETRTRWRVSPVISRLFFRIPYSRNREILEREQGISVDQGNFRGKGPVHKGPGSLTRA
jgi:hypothetical protein